MNTNEAPEKVYICNQVFPNYVDWEGSPINTKRVDNHDIEYTRTDAFIKKACEWLKNNASDYAFVYTDKIGNVADIDLSLVQDFKNYIKGE